MMNNDETRRISRWPLIVLFTLATVALITGGYRFYYHEILAIRTEKLNDLKAIAELKGNQIIAWRKERLGNAAMISSGIFQADVLQWLKNMDDPTVRADKVARLDAYRQGYGYQNVLLVAPDGRLLLSLDPTLKELEARTRELTARTVASQQPAFGDFFRCERCNQVHLDVAAPVLNEGKRTAAVLILRTDPEKLLYPLIQSWPTPSRSAETLLLRRDGEDALFLNVLRHRPDPALSLRIPLTRTDVPVVQAALGRSGEFEGRDYRGVPVLADLRPVPGSPWSMVAKVDADEILAEARYRGGMILILVALGVLMTGGLAAFVFSLRSRNLYKALFRAEQERRKAQEETRATLYGIGDGVIATDAAGQVTRMNLVAESLTGWSEAEALGRPIQEVFRIVNEETRATVENPADCVLREGRIVGLANHTMLIAKDGTERPIADSGAPIFNEQGVMMGVVLVFRDQSAERAAQAALRESEQRFRLLFERMPLGYQSLDADGCFIEANPAWLNLLGYERDEVIGHWFGEFLPPDYVEAFRQRFPKFKEAGEVHNEFDMKRKDGSIIRVAFDGKIGHDEKGDFKQTHCILTDITERKRAEALLLREQGLYKDLVNTIPVGMYRLRMRPAADWNNDNWESRAESHYSIDMVSDRFCEITGLSRQEFESSAKSVPDRIHPDDHPGFIQRNTDAVTSLSLFKWDGRMVLPDQRTIWVHLESIPRLLENGEVIWTGIVYDITERKQAEEEREKLQEQLLQSQKMESVGRLAGGVAHDFNNMLGVIIGHTEMALEQIDPAAPLHDDLQEIQKAAVRSADLTRQLLAFARKQTVNPKVLALNETVASVLKMLQRLIGENIELAWTPGAELWPVKMDPSQVDQMLANLAVNARDAIAGVGQLRIQTENVVFDSSYCRMHEGCVPGDYVLLAVSDTGSGMDKATLEHVFEPFFTTKEVGQGTGLGLAMVYGAVKQNQGFINVYSEPGRGTTFKIYLPRAEAAAAMAAPAHEKPAHGSETVLLAEDEEAILNLGTAILKKHGYTVLAARTPEEALALAEGHAGPIQLLITDVVMPGMNGKELKDRLKALRPEIRVLFMSGYTSDVIAHQGVIDDDVEFLQKPFSVNALAQKVRDVLQ